MGSFEKIVGWLTDKMKKLGAVFLVGMMFLTCIDVAGRFFGHPVMGSVELVGFMATLCVALALPYTHQVEGHIGVEILVRLLSEKTRKIIKLVTRFFAMVLIGIITWQMFEYARTMQQSGQVSISLELPEYIIIYLISVCFLVFFLLIAIEIVRIFFDLKGNK